MCRSGANGLAYRLEYPIPAAPITYSLVGSTPFLVGITYRTVGYWGYRSSDKMAQRMR